MKIVVYRPQLKEIDASYMKTDKNYINFLRNTNPEIDIISKTDKKFIENLASFLQTDSKVTLDTSSIKKFVKSLYDAKIFVETEKKVKQKPLTIAKEKQLAKKDMNEFINLDTKTKSKYRKIILSRKKK